MAHRTDFKEYADVTFADGSTVEMTEEDFGIGNNKYTDAAGCSTLPIGVAIARTVQLSLYNGDDRFAGHNFVGARIRLYFTFQLSETVEKIELGTFTVIDPETYGDTVTITAVDDMYRADKKYTRAYAGKVTLGKLYRDCCDDCGIAFATSNFRNSNYAVTVPDDIDCTYRQMLGYIAMLAGGNARVDRTGTIQIMEYDFSALAADNFAGHDLTDWINLKMDTINATITGLQSSVSGSDDESVLVGAAGYVLTLENPLMDGVEQECLTMLSSVFVGATWRKFDGDIPANPLIEFMDTAKITDRRGRTVYSVVTDIDFVFFGATTILNSAESVLRNSTLYGGADNKTLQKVREMVAVERTARETAIEQLSKAIAEGSGMFMTGETQEDGSTIYYLHDKGTLAESKNVVKITSDAFGFSTDGGKTYPFGWQITGDMVTRILSAEGVNAEWISITSDQNLSQYVTATQSQTDNLSNAVAGVNRDLSDKLTNFGNSLAELNNKLQDYATTTDLDVKAQELIASVQADINGLSVSGASKVELQSAVDSLNAMIQPLITSSAYVKIGWIEGEYDGQAPVMGIAIGQNVEVTGEKITYGGYTRDVIAKKNFLSIFTATEIGFWVGGTKAAYISNNQLYISEATVLNRFTVGHLREEESGNHHTWRWIGG